MYGDNEITNEKLAEYTLFFLSSEYEKKTDAEKSVLFSILEIHFFPAADCWLELDLIFWINYYIVIT